MCLVVLAIISVAQDIKGGTLLCLLPHLDVLLKPRLYIISDNALIDKAVMASCPLLLNNELLVLTPILSKNFQRLLVCYYPSALQAKYI